MDRTAVLQAATQIRDEKYPKALSVLAAGSLVRGDGTSTSDIDLIVVFDRLEAAYRESFTFAAWPVEAFVHDPMTLEYFFRDVDRPSGVPTLMTMVAEGVEVPRETAFGNSLKVLANSVIEDGPPRWSDADIDASRYALTNLVDDLHAPRSGEEQCATLIDLYPALATHFFRRRNRWAAKGKTIARALMADDPVFARTFLEAFDTAFVTGDGSPVERLVDELLQEDGGRLFAGYHRAAPRSWRRNEGDSS
ncbi:MAG: nucleotidyltransferase domain-containing protein [Pseudomonadota bacterium]